MNRLSRMMGLVLLAFTFLSSHAEEKNSKPFVVPEVISWQGGTGYFVPAPTLRIVTGEKKNSEVQRVAESLYADYRLLFNKKEASVSKDFMRIVASGEKDGDIVLSLTSDKKMGEEGYNIHIGKKIEVTAHSWKGLYWATRTLLQIMEQSPEHRVPCGTIGDKPLYALRGFMLDCGRKYIPLDYLRKLVKVMAYYKMNTLQVHLNDNGFPSYFDDDWNKTQSAWRLESTTYPGLTAKDGSYTKADFRDFQKEAMKIGVNIIPEIDAPAHSLAFTRYRPELTSKDCAADHLDIFNPATYEFLDGLYKEYLEGDDPVFVGKDVHVGTDEYSNKTQELKEKFRYFTDYYIKYVEKFGKNAVVWGSLTHAPGQTPVKSDNVSMCLWSHMWGKPDEMKKLGYNLISIPDGNVYIVPSAGYYYNYLNTQHLYDHWSPRNAGGAYVFDEGDPQLRGGMFAVWNDHPNNGITVKDIHHRVFDALPTIADKCWTSGKVTLPYADFRKNSLLLSEAPGINELGRIALDKKGRISLAEIPSGTALPLDEVGYDYTVKFHISAKKEALCTELFRSPNAVFYLSDPLTGMMGFSHEEHLYQFRYSLKAGEEADIKVQGTNRGTKLFVNGRLIDDLTEHIGYYGKDKKQMRHQQTLVFPLHKAGRFNSKITKFEAFDYLTE